MTSEPSRRILSACADEANKQISINGTILLIRFFTIFINYFFCASKARQLAQHPYSSRVISSTTYIIKDKRVLKAREFAQPQIEALNLRKLPFYNCLRPMTANHQRTTFPATWIYSSNIETVVIFFFTRRLPPALPIPIIAAPDLD